MKYYNLKQVVAIETSLNQVTFYFSNGDEVLALSEKYNCEHPAIIQSITAYLKCESVGFMSSDDIYRFIDNMIEWYFVTSDNNYDFEVMNQYKLNL